MVWLTPLRRLDFGGERQLKVLTLRGKDEDASFLSSVRLISFTAADDEFGVRRKPCTLGESGFLRAASWVLRCFIARLLESPGHCFQLDSASTKVYYVYKHSVNMYDVW